ncbi:unnamed protein product [Ilex paraguariensis]|uniref:Uncharacterized protein n=1 Tax=Ilex paraguariensis TaxID=185542 RepID=A0ABC8THN9_9AQUA
MDKVRKGISSSPKPLMVTNSKNYEVKDVWPPPRARCIQSSKREWMYLKEKSTKLKNQREKQTLMMGTMTIGTKPLKVKVDPGKPASLTWQRKLNTKENVLPSFTVTLKETISLIPLGYRLWRHMREEAARGGGAFLNPFTRAPLTSCQGVPLGAIGMLIDLSYFFLVLERTPFPVQEASEEVTKANFCVGNYSLEYVKINQF